MGTKITKSNVKSAIRDDKAHMDYLKRDVRDDQRAGGRYKDINQTADEKHISKLAGGVKADGHFLSKHWNHSSPLNQLGDYEGGPLEVGSNEPTDHVTLGAAQTDKLESYGENIPDGSTLPTGEIEEEEKKEEKEIIPGDSTEKMGSKLQATADKASKVDTNLTGKKDSSDFSKYTNMDLAKLGPLNSVEVVSGEVDGVAYGAADVDGHIAVDTSTVVYDDTMNLP